MDSGLSPPVVCSVPSCSRTPSSGRKKCDYHLEYMRNYKKVYRAVVKPEGICSANDCSQTTVDGYNLCPRCRERARTSGAKPSARKRHNAMNRRVRAEVIVHYGGQCVCCGEGELDVLTIDHVDGYKEGLRGGAQLAARLKREGYPDGYRVLCMTCNCVLGHHGYCPHSDLKQCKLSGRPRVHPEIPGVAAARRAYAQKYKHDVLSHYGLKCALCSEAHIECLTIDHVDQNGAQHRREEPGAKNLYSWLKTRGYPSGYRTLCFNCNWREHLKHTRQQKGFSLHGPSLRSRQHRSLSSQPHGTCNRPHSTALQAICRCRAGTPDSGSNYTRDC